MGGKIITFREILELNQLLEEKRMSVKVHLHDTCGRQSCSVDKGELLQEEINAVKEAISEYFLSLGIQTKFLNENLEFILN